MTSLPSISSFYIAKKLEEERVEEERVVFWPYRLEWEKNAKKLEEERVEEERVVLWPYRPFFFRCHREAMMVSRLHR